MSKTFTESVNEQAALDFVLAMLTTPPQPEQEPVAWVYPEGLEALKAGKPWTAYGTRQEPNNTALYLSPQPDIAPYAWVTFTPYGDEDDVWYENPEGHLPEGWTYKPLYDTTPPQRKPEQEPVATVRCINGITIGYLEVMQPVGTKLYTTPPQGIYYTPPQRTWVGLTKEERHEISMANRPYCADVMAAHEEELKRRNT